MIVSNILAGAICVVLGLVLYLGQSVNMIAGYNTLPPEEKAKYDAGALSRFAGGMCLIGGILLLAGGLVMVWFRHDWIGSVSWILFILIIIAGIIYANSGKRFMIEK